MVRMRRDRHDITIEILKVAISGKRKTVLMKKANISYAQAQQYLSILLEKGLLEIDKNRCFRTTDKGLEFLRKCKDCFLFKWNEQKR